MPSSSDSAAAEVTQQQIDEFALIASRRIASQADHVDHPAPPELPGKLLMLTDGPAPPIPPVERVDTPEKLQAELARLRGRLAPFLANHAPVLPAARTILGLRAFRHRLVSASNPLSGASDWKEVTIPHYGGPVGRAKAQYETNFEAPAARENRSLWICFRGVDYRATVWVNGILVGQHEGFFAPFEFEISGAVHPGTNELLVEVENDGPNKGVPALGVPDGEKIYAATGPGWDEPGLGWHHCPPGFGLWQPVRIESRARLFIDDLHARPLPGRNELEVWVETFSCEPGGRPLRLVVDVHGRNFTGVLCQEWEAAAALPPAGANRSLYKFIVPLVGWRTWELEAPWLCQLQVRLLDEAGELLDARERQIGLRTFDQDEGTEPKGRFFLNGREIRLRGANTMGFEQQAVMRGDFNRLVDDLLLAKLTHLNFLRFTQRPVQEEVYDYCDRLGLLAQTDFPHFGWVRRTCVAETLRQVGEMARLMRSHACRIVYSLVNEPYGHEVPHRFLARPELVRLLNASREVLLLEDPDAVVKACDGDYNPPPPFGMSDQHIYTLWYNGHAIPFGRLHRGGFPPVARGWCYGCGEFGAEGLDDAGLMRRRYPADWLPASPADDARWTPARIPFAQTARAHPVFFETPHGLENWVAASQAHQAFATRMMTEAFRRDRRLVSCAIHLFIDAWPAGWMKAIMDCERRPKPAWFAYREALTPLMVNLRSDRRTCWAGEPMRTEAWICNDTDRESRGHTLVYAVEVAGKVVASGRSPARFKACDSSFQGFLAWTAPAATTRQTVTLRLALLDERGHAAHDTSIDLEVFPRVEAQSVQVACDGEVAIALMQSGGFENDSAAAVILSDTWPGGDRHADLLARVKAGACLVLCNLQPGRHDIAGNEVIVFDIGSGTHLILEEGAQGSFVAGRVPSHPLLAGFRAGDFSYWTDEEAGTLGAVFHRAFHAPDWKPILVWGDAQTGLVAAERACGAGRMVICTLELRNQLRLNPVAAIFFRRLLTNPST